MLDKNQVAQLLGATEIFAKLQTRHLEAIANACKVVRYDPRARIVRQGEIGQELYIVASGQVSIISEEIELGIEQPILTLEPGQSFGETSLLAETTRSATVRAVGEVVCVALAKRSFESVLSQIPEVGLEISRYLALRLHKQCQLTGFRFVSFQELVFDPDLFGMFSPELLARLKAIPLSLKDGLLTVALTKPNHSSTIQALREAVPGLGIEPVACSWEDYEVFMGRYSESFALPTLPILSDSKAEIRWSGGVLTPPLSSLIGHALSQDELHVIVQTSLSEGLELVSPQEGGFKLLADFDRGQAEQLKSQLSAILQGSSQKPQVESVSLIIGEQRVSLQLSCLPTLAGPRYSLRFLDPAGSIPNFLHLAPLEALRDTIFTKFHRPGQQVLLAGPVRSGRSTTIYSLIKALREEQGLTNVVLLETRPLVELPGALQVKIERDWELALEAALTQRPDLLILDEAEPAVLSKVLGFTDCGHSTLATLKTSNALVDLARLRDESTGASPLENVGLLLQQVLVPKLCPHCRTGYDPSSTVRTQLQRCQLIEPEQPLFHSPGCSQCRGSGSVGRLAVLEALTFNPVLKEMVMAGRPEDAVRRSALSSGQLVPFQASAKVFLRQGELSATTALRFFGRSLTN